MTPRYVSDAYIQDGRITRSDRGARYRIRWGRLLVVAAMLALFIITNPSNGLSHWIPIHSQYIPDQQKGGFWSSIIRPQDTNFGLFTLSRTIDGVSVTALTKTVEVCQFDSPEEDELLDLLCQWADDTYCHGKQLLDWNDLPYTVNRLLCWVTMVCMISPLFVQRISMSKKTPFSTISSVLQQPTLSDLIRINLVVYPALVYIDRLMRTYLVIDGYTFRFLLAFFLLFFVIGGICNQIGSMFQQYPLVGMGAAFAACLGYHRARSSRSLFQFVDHAVSASTLFWLEAAMLMLSNKPAQFVAWILGGFVGHTFGQVHQQWLAEALRSNIVSGLRRSVKQFRNFF